MPDLRPPVEETPLSPEEVNIGLQEGILEGPVARAIQRNYKQVYVLQRQVVEVIDFYEGER